MTRDPNALAARRWDLLVVGGGIHGLFAAYDAAQRGLSVALIDAGDVGSGLSFNHQRTLHGGLRALQSGSLRKTRQQMIERRTWARIAPHLVRPLPFLFGTYRSLRRSRLAVRAGFACYERIARSRNDGVSIELHLPRTRLESAAATRRLFPGIAEAGLTGGAIWYDYQTTRPDRLTWLVAKAAEQAGAQLATYMRAVGPVRKGEGRVGGARVRDNIDGREFEIEAAVTLLAPGSALGSLRQAFGAGDAPPLLRAMNVLLRRPPRDIALAAPGASGRMLTATPWGGGVLVGTDQSDTTVSAEETTAPGPAVEAFLREVNVAFPSFQAAAPDVRFVHHGLAPAFVRKGRADLLAEPVIVRHAATGVPGLVSLVGVKYTTARWAAARAVDAVCAETGRPARGCRTAITGLPHAGIADIEGRLVETQRELGLELDADVMEHLAGWYGTEAPEVLRYAVTHGQTARLSPSVPILGGEIAWAVEQAGAVRLVDAVLRRTPLGSAGRPDRASIETAAAIMASRWGWSPDRTASEIALLEARYPPLSGPTAP